MGIGRHCNKLFLIDYGLAKKFRDNRTRQHIAYRVDKNLTGTARYASINAHSGKEQSRRDDMESLGYIFVYFAAGYLPWQGLKAVTKRQKYDKISDMKMSTRVSHLCGGLPSEFVIYFNYVRGLSFEAEPDYMYLKQLFRTLSRSLNFIYDYAFDWNLLKQKAALSASAVGGSTPTQDPATTADLSMVSGGPSMSMSSMAQMQASSTVNEAQHICILCSSLFVMSNSKS